MMLTSGIRAEYARMRAAGVGGIVGQDAMTCLALARARERWFWTDAVQITWSVESERYQDVYGTPAYQDEYYCCAVTFRGAVVASLGFIDECAGPYARIVENELLAEAFAHPDVVASGDGEFRD